MSRPAHSPADGAVATARAALPADEAARFDRLTSAVLASSSLGPALRSALPGPAGFRWLHTQGVSPTARPASLSAEQWLSLFAVWTTSGRVPAAGAPVARGARGRSSNGHGHAPGAMAAPRWH
ncbi:hypothetical protein ACI797_17580 [Geodermatophilus sp. SYSU D00691]